MAYLQQDMLPPEQGGSAPPARRPAAPAKRQAPAQPAQQRPAPQPAAQEAAQEAAEEITRIEDNDDAELNGFENEEVAQMLLDFRAKQSALTDKYNARLKELQQLEDEIERHLAKRLRDKRIPKSVKIPQPDGSVKTLSLGIDVKVMHTVADRKAFFSWVRATGNFQIVQSRIASKEMGALEVRLRDMLAAGKITEDQTVIPGVSVYRKEVLATSVRTTAAV